MLLVIARFSKRRSCASDESCGLRSRLVTPTVSRARLAPPPALWPPREASAGGALRAEGAGDCAREP